jgi:flagellar biogenesis protein FliO
MLLALSFLLVLVLHFSWELSRLEDRTRALAEEHALLRGEVEEWLGGRDGDASG